MKYLVYITLFLSLSSCSLSKFSKGKMDKMTSDSYTVPIESIDGIIVLKVKVNGIEGRFMLDNGFSMCALDKEFAHRAGIEFQKQGAVNDANNNVVKLLETRVDEIAIGPFNLKNSFANQLETALFLPCDSIDGVLGSSFINRMNWKIDFDQKTATLSKHEFQSTGQIVKFTVGRNNISSTTIEIDGKPVKAMIDFGYQGHIQINKTQADFSMYEQQAEVRIGIHSLSVSGLGGIDTTYLCKNIPISYNGKSLIATSELMIKSNLTEDGIIGVNYFENYEVIINNSSKQFILIPRKDYVTSVKNNYNVGLYSIESEIKIVQFNANDSVKDKVELLQNVVSIDGRPSAEFSDICFLKSYMKTKRLNNEIVIIQVEGEAGPIEIHAKSPIKQSYTNP